jgi:hypothetical protein
MSSLIDWSTSTDTTNGSSDSLINFAEQQLPSTLNNSNRVVMARLAEFYKDISGTLLAGGTANALTVTSNMAFTTYANGRILALRSGSDNSGATTLNVNSIGNKAVRKISGISGASDVALTGGEIQAGAPYLYIYSEAANSAAGAWILVNPTLFAATNRFYAAQEIYLTASGEAFRLTSTDDGTTVGPSLYLSRTSASPADGDLGGEIRMFMYNDAAEQTTVGRMYATLDDASDGTEDSSLTFQTITAGSITTAMKLGGGVMLGSVTDPGAGAMRTSGYVYVNSTVNDPGSSNTNVGITLRDDGRLYASSSTLTHSLNVNANGSVMRWARSGTEVGSVVVSASATTYNTSSDYRLPWKAGYVPLEGSGAFIDGLKPYHFPEVGHGGFIAHEFGEVSPVSVSGQKDETDLDGNPIMQSMQASTPDVMANIIAELQSLRRRVAALEA